MYNDSKGVKNGSSSRAGAHVRMVGGACLPYSNRNEVFNKHDKMICKQILKFKFGVFYLFIHLLN